MSFSFTDEQLVRETQLLVCELKLIADETLGDGAGLRAIGLDEDSDFAQSPHPDYLTDIFRLDIWRHVHCVSVYVTKQTWSENLPEAMSRLPRIVERIFSPAVLAEYEQDRIDHEFDDGLPGVFEPGAGDVPNGYFYKGIIAGLVERAAARLKVDRGDRLTLGEIALLLDIKEATVIANAHRKNFDTIEEGNRRYAEPSDVFPWMKKNGYKETREVDQVEEPVTVNSGTVDDVAFVPVAKDGTWFGPESRHAGRYVIGNKGEDLRFNDYFEALSALQKMVTPRWRRPNANGIGGVMTWAGWERKSRQEIEQHLAAITKPMGAK